MYLKDCSVISIMDINQINNTNKCIKLLVSYFRNSTFIYYGTTRRIISNPVDLPQVCSNGD